MCEPRRSGAGPALDGTRADVPLSLDLSAETDAHRHVHEGARLTASATGHQPPDDVSYDGHLDYVVVVL